MLAGCMRQDTDPSSQIKTIKIKRIDSYILNREAGAEAPDSLARGIDLYASIMGYPSPAGTEVLDSLSTSRVTAIFGPDIERVFGTESLEVSLDSDSLVDEIYGIASPYRQQIILSDSTILVALNHYLGADYPGYAGMPEYQRETKTPRYIARDVAQAVVRRKYPFKAVEGTLLERILYEGAVARKVMDLTGCNAAMALGITEEQYSDLDTQEAALWRDIAAGKLLYSTGEADIERLTSPAPFAAVAENIYSPMAGSYAGYRIVKEYLAREGSNVDELLAGRAEKSPHQLLIKSQYSPR